MNTTEPTPQTSNLNNTEDNLGTSAADLNNLDQNDENNANLSESHVAELQLELAKANESYLRAKAEAENARRRADEEVAKARKFAVESFAESLLPVKDSLEAALGTNNATPEQIFEGVSATLNQLTSALERNKVKTINPDQGTRFDPHLHQAISVIAADQEANTVVSVLQKGYLLADRVLRPALVTVSESKS